MQYRYGRILNTKYQIQNTLVKSLLFRLFTRPSHLIFFQVSVWHLCVPRRLVLAKLRAKSEAVRRRRVLCLPLLILQLPHSHRGVGLCPYGPEAAFPIPNSDICHLSSVLCHLLSIEDLRCQLNIFRTKNKQILFIG